MATAGDGVTTYQSGGAGGKLRKRPIRRSAQTTPYDRPPLAIRNNNPSLFAKLVNPASRLIYAGADRLFGVFRKRLPSVSAPQQPASLQGTIEEPRNGPQEAVTNFESKNSTGVVIPSTNEGGNLASISVATEISDLENMLKQKTFTRSEIERLTALLHSRTTESNVVEGDKAKLPSTSYHVPKPDAFTSTTLNKHVEEREIDATISTPVVSSRVFEDDVASPAELAKAYMGSRSTKRSPLPLRPSIQTPRQDLMLLNNSTTVTKTPAITHTPKTAAGIKTSENGLTLTTFRSRGRSALYNMPRTPYYRGPSTLSQKSVASPSPWEHEGSVGSSRMAAKRRSSALDDVGSGGPMRRIRQKANLLSNQSSFSKHKSELCSSQKLLLTNEPGSSASKAVEETGEISKRIQNYGSVPTVSSKMALKIFEQLERMSPKEKPSGSKLAVTTEKTVSPKVLSSSQSQDNKKIEGKHRVLFSDARESTFQSKDTGEENGSRNLAGHSNVLSSVNGNVTVPVSANAITETKAGSTKKRAFLMSAHEESLELDNDNHSNGHASISVGENKKLGASVLANNDVSTKSTLPEVTFKKGATSSPGSSVVNNQTTGFNLPAPSTSSSSGTRSSVLSQPTSKVDTVTPQNKPVFPTFGAVKANISPDAKPLGTTSLISSTVNNDQVNISASNKEDNSITQKPSVNLFGNSGSSSSTNLTTASASGIFSFGGSTNNSGIINGTSASSPSIFASSSSFQSSGTNTNKVSSSTSSTVLSSATTSFLPTTTAAATNAASSAAGSTFSTSVPAPIFNFGSATASSTSASMAPTSTFTCTQVTTSSNGGSLFGFSSSSATSATLTTNGFQANTHAASTAVTQAVQFKFGSGSSVMSSSASAGSLFSSSAPSFGLTSTVTSSEIKSIGFSSTPSFGLNSTVATSDTKSGSSTTNMFGSGFSSTPSFGLTSTVATSDTKSGSSTGTLFGSAPYSFGASSTSMPSASSSPFMFGSSNTGASTGSSVFSFSSKPSSPVPVFGNSPTNNNDSMSMEDSMADDTNQTPVSSVPAFGQATPPGFMFGSATSTPPPPTVQTPGFMFGAQTNQPQTPSPFSAPQFNAGGSFSLGSGGDEKANRRIVKVKRQIRRK